MSEPKESVLEKLEKDVEDYTGMTAEEIRLLPLCQLREVIMQRRGMVLKRDIQHQSSQTPQEINDALKEDL